MRTKSDKHIKPKLKPQHQIFVEGVAKGETQSVAYRKAFPNVKNRNTAEAAASRLLRNVNISEAVQERIQRALDNCNVTPEEVIGGSVRQMRNSIVDVLDDEGSYDFQKAKETGAIDFVKKQKETIRHLRDKDGNITETIKTVEIEMLTNQDGRKEVIGFMELAKNKANLEKPAQVAKFINACFSDIEQKAIDDPNETFEFTRSEVIEIFCLKCDVSPELVAPLVRECLLLED